MPFQKKKKKRLSSGDSRVLVTLSIPTVRVEALKYS